MYNNEFFIVSIDWHSSLNATSFFDRFFHSKQRDHRLQFIFVPENPFGVDRNRAVGAEKCGRREEETASWRSNDSQLRISAAEDYRRRTTNKRQRPRRLKCARHVPGEFQGRARWRPATDFFLSHYARRRRLGRIDERAPPNPTPPRTVTRNGVCAGPASLHKGYPGTTRVSREPCARARDRLLERTPVWWPRPASFATPTTVSPSRKKRSPCTGIAPSELARLQSIGCHRGRKLELKKKKIV